MSIFNRIIELKKPKTVNVLLHAFREFYRYTWTDEVDVTTFWAGLSLVTYRIEAAGGSISDVMFISKVLECLPDS
jgi:hypothetical protein